MSKSVNKCPFQMKSLRQSENARYLRDWKILEVWITFLPYNASHCHQACSRQGIAWRILLWRIFCFFILLLPRNWKRWWMCRERRLKLRGMSELLQVGAVTLAPPASPCLYLSWSRGVLWSRTEIDWEAPPLVLTRASSVSCMDLIIGLVSLL